LKAEILCIGTELLLGDVINTNAAFLGKELSGIGTDLYYVTTVGDNPERIVDSLRLASQRADIIITSGGLGPTEDDLTHECIAEFLGVEQDFHQDIADRLESWFKSRGRELVKSNLKQAYLPHGADVLPNPHGTAPGIIYNKSSKIILTFPGVPSELKDMWNNTAKSFLQNLMPVKSVIKSRILRFVGEGESALAEKVSDFLNLSNPTVAPLAGKGEVVLRVTAKAEDEKKAEELIRPVEQEIIHRFPKYYYGADNDTLPSVIGQILKDKKQTIAVAESFTGGLLAERIVSVPGASNYFRLGMVCYSTSMKIELLGVDKDIIDNHTVYSAEVASQMAEKVRKLAGSGWGIGTTGLAGPATENDDGKVGTIFVAVASENRTEVRKLNYAGMKREDIIFLGSQAAINLLRLTILELI
jgi:nicotinamide-nucleotide amidase